MREEIQSLLNAMEVERKEIKGMRSYYVGQLFQNPVVLVFSRWGKVASATTVTQLINDFDIGEILFTGVAGAAHADLNIGDVVIGRHLFQHDLDASPLMPPLHVPLLGISKFRTDERRCGDLHKAALEFLDDPSGQLKPETLLSFDIKSPKTVIGDIASGDQFVSTSSQLNQIRALIPGIHCVEMEGASVAQVCYEYKVPFSILRTISDKADDNAHIDFPRFANEIASQYALGILANYLKP